MIPYGRQDISDDDVDAVVDVLRSDFLTQGPVVPRFEERVLAHCSARHAVAVNSATSALHIACLALGLGKGDWLWTSPITFVASANCALYCGARVDFVDIDPRTYNMCPVRLADKLALAEREGRIPKVVVPVDLCGQPCHLKEIRKLSDKYGFHILEDASHAIGSSYLGEPTGNCRYSDITVFSFHPVKIITTGEGGMALTNDAALAERMQLLQSHGITRNPAQMVRAPSGSWYYEQVALGFNYRMTDIQAALGISQMGRLEEFVARRHILARRYDSLLANFPVATPWQNPNGRSSLHLYVVRLEQAGIGGARGEVFEAMRTAGIGVNLHYIPVYRQPYYETMGFMPGYCREAERYYSDALTLPIYPSMTEAQQDTVIEALGEAIAA